MLSKMRCAKITKPTNQPNQPTNQLNDHDHDHDHDHDNNDNNNKDNNKNNNSDSGRSLLNQPNSWRLRYLEEVKRQCHNLWHAVAVADACCQCVAPNVK